MTNIEIKELIKTSRFKNYEIAATLGIAETSFSRMFRKQLSEQQIEKIKQAIEVLRKEGQ
ncbi:hypothetical protein LJC10_03070 [Selenomonadales bacterium OttesenSCG-928-I06]|nr:hypothetical protein [Selenomonadales bacterium OttesenSCG-928-I06]